MIKCTGAINMGYCQYSIPKEILARVSIETRKLFLLMMTEQPGVSGKLIRKTTQYNYNKYTRITVIISGLLGAIYQVRAQTRCYFQIKKCYQNTIYVSKNKDWLPKDPYMCLKAVRNYRLNKNSNLGPQMIGFKLYAYVH